MKKETIQGIDILDKEAIDLQGTMSSEERDRILRGVLNNMKNENNVIDNEMKLQQGRRIRRKLTRYQAIAAAVAAVIFIPAVGFAATRAYTYFSQVSKEDSYAIKVGTTDTKIEGDTTIKAKANPAKVKLVSKAKDFEMSHSEALPGRYTFMYDGKDKKKKLTGTYFCTLMQVDENTKANLIETDVKEWTKIESNDGHPGLMITTNGIDGTEIEENLDDSIVDGINAGANTMYVFYEEEGYILQITELPGGGTKDAFLDFAGKISVEKTDKMAKQDCITVSDYLKQQEEAAADIADQEKYDLVDVNDVLDQKDTLTFAGVDYQVKNVKVLDNIKSLDKSRFHKSVLDNFTKIANLKGELLSYNRETLKEGDGVSEPATQVAKTEKVKQKLVLIEMTIRNNTDKKVSTVAGDRLVNLDKKGSQYEIVSDYEQYNRPDYISNTRLDEAYNEEAIGQDGNDYFDPYTIEAGESKTFHVGYLVDEDMTDNLCLVEYDYSNQDNPQNGYISLAD